MTEKLEEYLVRYEELNHQLSDPQIIADRDQWQKLVREHARVEEIVQTYEAYKKICDAIREAKELLESGEAELAELAREELAEAEPEAARLELELTQLLAPRDPDDDKNVVLEVRAGTGGEEAALFAMDLLRMYGKYSERQGWTVEPVSVSETDIGGVKEAVCIISGGSVFRRLRYESGVHRVQRIPSTESGGRIHTSAATVAVLPEAEAVDVNINPADLVIETHRSSGAGGQHINKTESAVRMIHVPTGIVVNCQDERSQIKNREKALRIMQTRVADFYRSSADQEYSQARKKQVGSGDRSERIRTYNFPQGRVTDHRIGMTIYKLDSFMEGDMDEMIDALVLAGSTGQLKEIDKED
ncbi:MAG: peptide chain release factor 1 [Clostridiales bacterium]|nr:peptide chain release factor 1 [Clostridiales bacterium]